LPLPEVHPEPAAPTIEKRKRGRPPKQAL